MDDWDRNILLISSLVAYGRITNKPLHGILWRSPSTITNATGKT